MGRYEKAWESMGEYGENAARDSPKISQTFSKPPNMKFQAASRYPTSPAIRRTPYRPCMRRTLFAARAPHPRKNAARRSPKTSQPLPNLPKPPHTIPPANAEEKRQDNISYSLIHSHTLPNLPKPPRTIPPAYVELFKNKKRPLFRESVFQRIVVSDY